MASAAAEGLGQEPSVEPGTDAAHWQQPWTSAVPGTETAGAPASGIDAAVTAAAAAAEPVTEQPVRQPAAEDVGDANGTEGVAGTAAAELSDGGDEVERATGTDDAPGTEDAELSDGGDEVERATGPDETPHWQQPWGSGTPRR